MTDSTLKMMTGTEQHMDYVQIARQGDLVLGVKLETISDGRGFGVPGTTYFGVRVRTSLFPEDKPEGEQVVVSFKQKTPENFAEAWPGVAKWDKKNSDRCSVTMGMLIEGKIDGPDAERKAFYSEIKDGALAIKFAEQMTALAGDAGTVVHDSGELAGYFDEKIKGFVDNFEKAAAFNRKVAEEAKAKMGKFMTIGDLLKKANDEADAELKAHHDDEDDDDDLDAEEEAIALEAGQQ